MAQKIKLDLSQFKASGVYTLEFDASANVILTTQTIRLVVGFSNKGPFNAPVYIPDVTTALAIFGDIDKNLEAKGSFFQRSIFTCLNAGPIFALNLLRLNNDLDSPTADVVPYFGYSVDTEQSNGILREKLLASYYNKERFWYADTNYFLATRSIVDQGRIFNIVNLGNTPMSIITRKSTDASPPLQGYDIFAIDWYGPGNVPSYVNPYDYISDWFIDVIAVAGDWTNYDALSQDPQWSSYFTPNGFIKSQITNFLNDADVNIVTIQTGCLIIDFVNLNGNNEYIQTLINNNTPSTGLFCAVDEDALENLCTNPYKVDLVGNHLIDELSGDRDIQDAKLNFLSYDQNLLQDYLYTKNYSILTDSLAGATAGVGTLYCLPSTAAGLDSTNLGGTAGVPYEGFLNYNPAQSVAGLHFLTAATGASGSFSGLTSTDLLNMKTFLTPSSTSSPYIVGTVSGITAGFTDNVISQFSNGDLIKLQVANVNEVSGRLQIAFSHPLDITRYRDLGIVVTPYAADYSTTTYLPNGITGDVVGGTAYIFGASDTLGIQFSLNPGGTGATSSTAPTGYANALTGQLSTAFYQNVLYAELQNGDLIYTNPGLTAEQYLTYALGVDRDQYSIYYAFAYTNVARNATTLTPIENFGATYASNTNGQIAGFPANYKLDIVSSVASINEFIEVSGGIGGKISVTSFKMNSDLYTVSVGDLLVSTDQDLCQIENTNRQQRLTKVTSVATTSISGIVTVTTARPIYFYSGGSSGLQVQKFQSIPQFTTSFDFTYLEGFQLSDYHRPDGTDARVTAILDVMYNTNIAATLATKDVISFRYIVDTFSGVILPNSKYQLSKLAMMRGQALALINAPSMAQFQDSVDPRFTNAPTAVDPFPSLETRYIADGGNLSLNPTYTFSLPSQPLGASYAAFYAPYITLRENNRNVNVPPAAFVSNNFVAKFANGEPYAIVAGQKRGTIAGTNLVGVEYDFTLEDRGYLEPFGINPIIKKRGLGVVIFGNQTAYQTVNSAFSLVHVRDLLISVENDVEQILSNYLFDFNEDSIRLEIKTLVDNYLDGVRSGGGIYAYQVIMDASNNPPSVIDQNIGIIDVILEPARGIQKFINRITVTRTGGIAAGGFIQFV
jgi:hypothetical protein